MKLKEFLDDYWKDNPDKIVRIGSQTGFLFIGNKATYDEHFKKSTDIYLIRQNKYRDRAYRSLVLNCQKPITSFEFNVDNVSVPAPDSNVDAYQIYHNKVFRIAEKADLEMKRTLKLLEVISKRIRAIKSADEYINNYEPFEDREILEKYKSREYTGWIVKITGSENGEFWFKEEYDQAITQNYKFSFKDREVTDDDLFDE